MNVYTVPAQFIFKGTFDVEATSFIEAIEKVEKSAGLVLGGKIHTNDEAILDWDFATHPVKVIENVQEVLPEPEPERGIYTRIDSLGKIEYHVINVDNGTVHYYNGITGQYYQKTVANFNSQYTPKK